MTKNDEKIVCETSQVLHLLEELHEAESVAVLLRDSHANNIGSSSNQSSISF